MRKSTIFISTILTTFALVILYGVVSADRNISTVREASGYRLNPPRRDSNGSKWAFPKTRNFLPTHD